MKTMVKNIVFFYNSKREVARDFSSRAISFLKNIGMKVESICVNKGGKFLNHADIAIAAGGDGTALYAARSIGNKKIPLISVNAGGLGFLSCVEPCDFEIFFRQVLDGKFEKIERFFLEIIGPFGKHIALNDCVIRSSQARAFNLDVKYQGDFLSSYFADGLIISTPTGSTAYSLAAMGPIIMPSANVLCLSPICPHTLTHRPMVLPAEGCLEVLLPSTKDKRTKVTVSIDGQESFNMDKGDLIKIRKSNFSLTTLSPKDFSYFAILRQKLSWGQRK